MKSIYYVLFLLTMIGCGTTGEAQVDAPPVEPAVSASEPAAEPTHEIVDLAFEIVENGEVVSKPRIRTLSGRPLQVSKEADTGGFLLDLVGTWDDSTFELVGTFTTDGVEQPITLAGPFGQRQSVVDLPDGTEITVLLTPVPVSQ